MKHVDFARGIGVGGLALSLFLASGFDRCRAQLGYWFLRPSGTVNPLRAVTFGNDLFVAVGDAGTVLTSQDSIAWTLRDPGTNVWLLGAGFGSDTFVAVGYSGALLTSTNGVKWIERSSGTSNWLCDVAYGNGRFVAVGDVGTILTSTDAVTWTRATLGTTALLNAVAWGGSRFVAVGYNAAYPPAGVILTSSDGLAWVSGNSGTRERLCDVAYGNGMFVAVGYAGTLLTSADGASWGPRDSHSTNALSGVGFSDEFANFVAVGEGGVILRSYSPDEWINTPSPTDKFLYSVAAGGPLFAAVGDAGAVVSKEGASSSTSLELIEPRTLPGGSFEFKVSGALEGEVLTVLDSPDLKAWNPLGTLIGGTGPIPFVDLAATNSSMKFYRVLSPNRVPSP